MRYLDTLKKILVLGFAALSVSIFYVSNINAQGGGVLQEIASNTLGTMNDAGQILTYTAQIVQLLTQQTSDGLGNNDADNNPIFSYIGSTMQSYSQFDSDFATSQSNQDTSQQQVFADLLGVSTNQFTGPLGTTPQIQQTLATVNSNMNTKLNANEMAYASLLGKPPVQNVQFNNLNYVENAAGFAFQRPIPGTGWQGKKEDQSRYIAYFQTITPIQSFNSYLLYQMKADFDADNNPTMNVLRSTLISTVANKTYIAQIAGESMGKVFRQLLLFTAQNFVLNAEIQQNLRQLVAAQAMTNSLLILFNQPTENQLIRNAMGKPLGT